MRVVVKNLPERTTEEKLRAYFNQKGTVTDVFLLRNGRGDFRRVAFIGYASAEEAANAATYFNSALFENHKISVERATEGHVAPREQGESTMRKILYSKTILIRGIVPGTDEAIITRELATFGRVVDLQLRAQDTRVSAVARFAEGAQAVAAAKTLRVLAGMRVRVGAFTPEAHPQQRDHFNTLFFSFDAVVKRTSEAQRLARTDIVDLRDPRLGSRMALLETSLVTQTKEFLAQHGIFLDALTGALDRRTLILRCPDVLGAVDLVATPCKVSVAPSGCLALLAFTEEGAAAECQRALNMRRHRSNVVYCEFAPLCAARSVEVAESVGATERAAEAAAPHCAPAKKLSNKLIVKNVPFQATTADLKAIFSSCAQVTDIRLPLKNSEQHRGFAFLIVDSPRSATAVLERFGTSTHLFGRRLVLEVAKA